MAMSRSVDVDLAGDEAREEKVAGRAKVRGLQSSSRIRSSNDRLRDVSECLQRGLAAAQLTVIVRSIAWLMRMRVAPAIARTAT